MKIKTILLLILAMVISGVSFAQMRDPSSVGESSSTGVWPSVDSGSSVGYDSGNHGNVN